MIKAFITLFIFAATASLLAQEAVKIDYNEKHIAPHPADNARHDSLKFAYLGAPTRPVKEFSAIVTRLSLPKEAPFTQRCAETHSYRPGSYTLVINTLPEEKRNMEIGQRNEAVVLLLQPGYAKFTCAFNTPISLYAKDGKSYTVFHTLKAGGVESRRLQLQPGIYQARYIDGNGKIRSLSFIIRPTQQTEVILKDPDAPRPHKLRE